MSQPKLTALIPGAGIGSRLGLGPKAVLEINQQPIYLWLAKKLSQIADQVIIALPKEHTEQARQRLAEEQIYAMVISGRDSRQKTLHKLISLAEHPQVMIQDAARPFVSHALLEKTRQAATQHGAAGAFLATEVPVGIIEQGFVQQYLNSTQAGIFQAPQVFQTERLKQLMDHAEREGIQRQSTAQLWIDAGLPFHAVMGEKQNIKLTTAEDWKLAEYLKEYLTL